MKGFDCHLEIPLEGKTGKKNCLSQIKCGAEISRYNLALKISSLVIRCRFLTVGTTMKPFCKRFWVEHWDKTAKYFYEFKKFEKRAVQDDCKAPGLDEEDGPFCS